VVNVEFGTSAFSVAVREIEGREREILWADALNPQLEEAQKKTTRKFPVLLFTRIL
jgi:hypothetical protein